GTVGAPPYGACSRMSTSVQAGFVPVLASPQSYRAGIPRTIHSSSRIDGTRRRSTAITSAMAPPITNAGDGPRAATIAAKATGASGSSSVPPKASMLSTRPSSSRGHVLLHGCRPQDPDTDELGAESGGEDHRRPSGGDEPDPGDRKADQDRAGAVGDAPAPGADLRAGE